MEYNKLKTNNMKTDTPESTRQNVEIPLEGLSNKWRKRAIKAAKEVGYTWAFGKKDRFKNNHKYLNFDQKNGISTTWSGGGDLNDYKTLTLPADWDRFIECIGAECVPKEGEIWTFVLDSDEFKFKTLIFRVKDKLIQKTDGNSVHSFLSYNGNFGTGGIGYNDVLELRPATLEEAKTLERAENANGYVWNGTELKKVDRGFNDIPNHTVLYNLNDPNDRDDDVPPQPILLGFRFICEKCNCAVSHTDKVCNKCALEKLRAKLKETQAQLEKELFYHRTRLIETQNQLEKAREEIVHYQRSETHAKMRDIFDGVNFENDMTMVKTENYEKLKEQCKEYEELKAKLIEQMNKS